MTSIGVVSRHTGIQISTLRKWEARYGFPVPARKASGQRGYRAEEIDTLKLVARRVANGERVGAVMEDVLGAKTSAPATTRSRAESVAPEWADLVNALLDNDWRGVQAELERAKRGRSLQQFIDQFAAPLSRHIGSLWVQGTLPIFGEHLYSSVLESFLLRQADFAKLGDAVDVLLVALAGEKHTLGLSMVHAVLTEAGVPALRLASDLPAAEIVAAAHALGVRAVAISVSSHYPPKLLRKQLAELRNDLPKTVQIWLGGGGSLRLPRIPVGISTFDNLVQFIAQAKQLEHRVHNAAGEAFI